MSKNKKCVLAGWIAAVIWSANFPVAAAFDGATAAQEQRGDVRFTVPSVRVEHAGLRLNEKKLQKIAAQITGREITVKELNGTIAFFTRYARRKGYLAATAHLPAQTAVGGNLLVRIVPGRLGEIRVENDSRLRSFVVDDIFANLHEGEIILSRKAETALRNTADLAGVKAKGILSPGEKEGTSDLTVKITDDKPMSLAVYGENYGNKTAGRYRYGLQTEYGNAWGAGDKLTVGALVSSENQHNYRFAYEFHAGYGASKIGIGVSRSDYELGAWFRELGAKGITNTYGIFGKTPLLNTAKNSLAVNYGYDYRRITDEMSNYNFSWKKHSHVFHTGVEGVIRLPAMHISCNAAFHTGTLVPDSEAAKDLADIGGNKGRFAKGTLDVTALQKPGKNFDLLLKISAQKAANNLDSSEHIYLGGAHGIRAYPQGEAAGDEGLCGTVELFYRTPLKGLSLSTYFDAGRVNIAKTETDDNMTLKGWGIGLSYVKPNDWFIRLDYARRIGKDNLMSDDAKSRQRMWFLAAKMF